MANNPYVNKVELANGTTLIDISDTTAEQSDVMQGKYFYTASGAKAQGTAIAGITDVQVDGTSVVSSGVAEIDLTGKADSSHTHTTSNITDFPTIPSKVSDLTNDSGYITSYTDEKLKTTATTENNTPYYFVLTEASSDAQTKKYNTLLSSHYWSTAARTYLTIGNSSYYSGVLVLNNNNSSNHYKGYLLSDNLTSSDVTWTLPNNSGTIALTSNIPSITLNGSSTTSPSFYAPTSAGTLGDVLKSNGYGAPSWTSAELTDEKLGLEAITSGSTYYPILTTNSTTATKKQFDTTGISYVGTSGSSINGTAILTLGNNVSGGSGKYGKLTIYSASQYGTTLQTGSAFTANRTIYLPDKSGTIALLGDITTATANYLLKPSTDISEPGWILKSGGLGANPFWDYPERFKIYVTEDSDNPGTYCCDRPIEDIWDAVNCGIGLAVIVTVETTGEPGNFEEYILTNYRIESYSTEIDGDTVEYYIIWFSDTQNYWDSIASKVRSRAILCGIYIDNEDHPQFNGEEVFFKITDDCVNSITTTAGAHTAITSSTGHVSFNVPTKTSDLTNDSDFMNGMFIASYGTSTYAEVLEKYQHNHIIYCRAAGGTNPAGASKQRMAFLAYVDNQDTPTEFEFQYYRSMNAHSNTDQGDEVLP